MTRFNFLKIAMPLAGLVIFSQPAFADQWPVFDYIKLTPTGIQPTIIVESENKTSWTKVKSMPMQFAANFNVKMKEGEVTDVRVVHGIKTVYNPGGEYIDVTHLKFEDSIQTSTNNLGIAALTAVGACNAKLKTGAEIYQDQFIEITTDLKLVADATGTSYISNKDITRDNWGTFPLTVKCVAVPIDSKNELPKPPPPPVVDIDDMTTGPKFKVKSANLVVHIPPSKVCPSKGALTAQFVTNFDGNVTFIYRQAGGGKSQPIKVKSKKMPNGKFMAVHVQYVPVSKATDTKYMVEVVGKGIISDWESFKVPCKIKLGGNGELANPPVVPFKVMSAQLGIIGPKTKLCPNSAKLMAWFKTSKPGKVGFRLMRKNGPVGPMIFVQSVKAGSGYMATYSKSIVITTAINTSYSAIVPGAGGLASNFVPLKASCAVGLPGGKVGN